MLRVHKVYAITEPFTKRQTQKKAPPFGGAVWNTDRVSVLRLLRRARLLLLRGPEGEEGGDVGRDPLRDVVVRGFLDGDHGRVDPQGEHLRSERRLRPRGGVLGSDLRLGGDGATEFVVRHDRLLCAFRAQ